MKTLLSFTALALVLTPAAQAQHNQAALIRAAAKSGELSRKQVLTSDWMVASQQQKEMPADQAIRLLKEMIHINRGAIPSYDVKITSMQSESATLILEEKRQDNVTGLEAVSSSGEYFKLNWLILYTHNRGSYNYQRVKADSIVHQYEQKRLPIVRYVIEFQRPLSTYTPSELAQEAAILGADFEKKIAKQQKVIGDTESSPILRGTWCTIDQEMYRNNNNPCGAVPKLSTAHFLPGFALTYHGVYGPVVDAPRGYGKDRTLEITNHYTASYRLGIAQFIGNYQAAWAQYRQIARETYNTLIGTGVATQLALDAIRSYASDLQRSCGRAAAGSFSFSLQSIFPHLELDGGHTCGTLCINKYPTSTE